MRSRAIWTVLGGLVALGAAVTLVVTGVIGNVKDGAPGPVPVAPWTIAPPSPTATSTPGPTPTPGVSTAAEKVTLAERLPAGADEAIEQLVYDVATELTREDSAETRQARADRLAPFFVDGVSTTDLRTVSAALTRLDELDAARIVGEPGPVASQEFVGSDTDTITYRVVVPTTLTVTRDDRRTETYTAAGTFLVTVAPSGDAGFLIAEVAPAST